MAKLIGESSKSRIDIKNINDLNTITVDRKFGRPEDYIEVFIADLNDNIIVTIPNFTEYNIGKNTQGLIDEIDIDVLSVLISSGFTTGRYKLYVNIQKRKIFNTTTPAFSIKEISPSKTELKLSTTEGNTLLDFNSRNFISEIQNSTYFRDFTLNFGNNVNITAINIDIDRSNPNEFLLNIKLLKPLPQNITEGTKLNIVEDITEPIIMTYDLGSLPPPETTTPLRGPNFKIETKLNSSVPTDFRSYDNILATSTTSSYQKLISKLDGYEIPEIDYSYVRPVDSSSIDFETVTPSHFENFVHFGSAKELLKNFEYKLKLIEIYNTQLSELNNIPGGTSSSIITTNALSSVLLKKENLIQGFSGYEQFLYYDPYSPFSWPKIPPEGSLVGTEPQEVYPTTSPEALTWLGSEHYTNPNYGGQLLSASVFDSQNPNRLFKLTPTFIGDKDENRPYEIFCDMVGEHFDPIWTHIKEITQIRDNSHTLGVSKHLVYYALQSLGIETLDQFENEDLINYIFGQTFIPEDSSTVILATTKEHSKQDITKEIWKRLYHNAPYLLKTKGTERGLRALITCYGIPSTILDVKEFGGSQPSRDNYKLYTYDKFTQVLSGDSLDGTKKGMFIETEWSSSNTFPLSASAKTVEFRIKPIRSDDRQHLFSLTSNSSSIQSGSDLHLLIQPYTSSDDFYITDDRTQYGKLELHQFTASIASTNYFNLYNGEFWDINLSTNGTSGSNSTITFGAYQSTHLRDVVYYTQSVSITEKANAESFGNAYYGGNTPGVSKAFIGGIKDTITNGISTSSLYTNNVTSSFDLGFNGSISELRYYFGEVLSHTTLKLHALEPLMYGGNSISSSYDHLILRFPLSFELDLATEGGSIIPSSSQAWNTSPTPPLVGPITGSGIQSSSLIPNDTGSNYSGQPFGPGAVPPLVTTLGVETIFTVDGTPLMQSHHPNQNVNYLNGFTYFRATDVELLVETHHIPTPNTIGKSPVNRKIYIDNGTTDDDILSPDILSQFPTSERQVPDFSNIGIYLSPQNEINEDIIYTLGTFSLDTFLGDPREETLDTYTSFKPLINQYFKKLKAGEDRYNIWDFTRWVQFLDHTLFELIKKFTPQKSTDKTGLLIEPHYLERTKFKRYHPIGSRPEYEGTIQDITASFTKTAITGQSSSGFYQSTNTSQLDGTTGSAVLSFTTIALTGSIGYNTTLDILKTMSGSNKWEQGPLIPNSTGSVKQRNSSGSNVLRPGALTPYGNYLNSTISKKVSKNLFKNRGKELLADPTLETGNDWTVINGGGTTPGDGTGTYTFNDDGFYSQLNTGAGIIEFGKTYELTITVDSISAGTSIKLNQTNFHDATPPGETGTFTTFFQGTTQDGTTTPRTNLVLYHTPYSGATNGAVISFVSLKEVNPLEKVEFDDSLLDLAGWKRSRYDGSKLTGAKIGKYTVGDITYGLNPVVDQKSTALYFGKNIIGGTEDDNLVTIKNHSYVDIEKILIINTRNDSVTTIDLKNETFKGINGYIANDFKNGSSFNIELLDEGIQHKLKDSYKAKFNQGYLYKILEHKGINGGGSVSGQGIEVGFVDVSGSLDFPYATSTSQSVLCYGDDIATINSSTIVLKENTLTDIIWPQDQTFGRVDFITSSATNHYYSSWDNLGMFINSMLIPIASESQYRLFGTVNLGQPLNVADYTISSNAGIKSISTFEFDLKAYIVTSSLHEQISSSANMSGFGKALVRPDHLVIPIMQGPHDVIKDKKTGANITWPADGGDTGQSHGGASNIQLQYYFGGDTNIGSAIYQISYLEETNTIIANIKKPIELANDVGDKGYILIPSNIDKEISSNLDFYLNKAGIKPNSQIKKLPLRGR